MNTIPSNSIFKKRRGLSSIVGALIFVVLMVATFAVLGVALDSQTDIVDVSRDVADAGLKKQQEAFQINTVTQGPGENLSVEVKNKGQNPTEIFTMVLTNSSDVTNGYPTQTYAIPFDNSLLPPNHNDPIDVVEALDLKLKLPAGVETDIYDIKLVSSLGTIQTYKIECRNVGGESECGPGIDPTGPGGLAAQLFLDGPNGINTKTTTVVMFVTNTGDVTLSNISPVRDCVVGDMIVSILPAGGLGDVDPCILDAPSPITLIPGQTALFKWDGTISGDIDDVFTFCNQASGEEPDATLVTSNLSCDEMIVIDPNDCGGCDGGSGATIILVDELLIRPSLFMVVPSPFGEDADCPQSECGTSSYKAIWGANIVNPTERSMSVTKVTMVVYPPTANDNDIIIPENCEIEMIRPSSMWECPKENTILWQDLDTPVDIDPYSAVSFLVGVEPGSPAGAGGQDPADIDALIVQTNAFTTVGSFGKSDYQSTMKTGDEVLANVYLTNVTESREYSDILGVQSGMIENQTSTFMVTIADMDNSDETYIHSGARLIINVPRDWEDVSIINANGFDGDLDSDPLVDSRVNSFGDGSTQIIGILSDDLGGSATSEDLTDARTIKFSARPPMNDIPGVSQPHIMYVLADGKTGNNFPLGPLNEIILVVDPQP
jgi:hypothetical protein